MSRRIMVMMELEIEDYQLANGSLEDWIDIVINDHFCDELRFLSVDGLTKLEVSQCIEALSAWRDSCQQKLEDGMYLPEGIPIMQEMIANDTALIKKLDKIWYAMPVDKDPGDSVDQQYELMMELISIDIKDITRDSYGLELDADVLGELTQKVYDTECGTGDGPDYEIDMRDRADIIKEIIEANCL